MRHTSSVGFNVELNRYNVFAGFRKKKNNDCEKTNYIQRSLYYYIMIYDVRRRCRRRLPEPLHAS